MALTSAFFHREAGDRRRPADDEKETRARSAGPRHLPLLLMKWLVVVSICAVGCGKIGYDATLLDEPESADSGVDAEKPDRDDGSSARRDSTAHRDSGSEDIPDAGDIADVGHSD